MTHEITVDRDLDSIDLERTGSLPFRVLVTGRFAGSTLAEENNVRDYCGAFPLEGIGGQADRPDEIGF